MVTVRKWGAVSLGRTALAETLHRYKTNWRSILRRKAEAREVKRKRRREKQKGERKRREKRTRKKARVEAREGRSEPERKRASPQVSKRACGARVGVSSADGE